MYEEEAYGYGAMLANGGHALANPFDADTPEAEAVFQGWLMEVVR